MSRVRLICAVLGAMTAAMLPGDVRALRAMQAGSQSGAPPASGARDLFVTVGKSLVVESPVIIQRVSIGDATKAEAVAVNPREVLVNGKAEGETSLIIWQTGGNRLLFDLRIQPSTIRLETVRQELAKELPGQDVTVTEEGKNVFLRGTVNSLMAAQRAESIAATLGKPVNLLHVKVPQQEEQILLKVKFADVDRSATQELGVNLFSTGAANMIGELSTGQFTAPQFNLQGEKSKLTLSDALNIFMLRSDINLGATVRALQARSLLQILAEPNLMTINGKAASFLAGGEFPVPMMQATGSGSGAITIVWREYGIRINFLPTITPRGTIRLKVAPEVSSLDSSHGVVIAGYAVPALATRRVQTEVELKDGESFAIAGLLDNQVMESWNKVPGLGDIPVLGKLFQSRAKRKTNAELMVLVTPELVHPVPTDQRPPEIQMPTPFLEGAPMQAPRTPGISVTGSAQPKPLQESVPVEQLQQMEQQGQAQQAPTQTIIQLVPNGAAAVPQAPANPGSMTGPLPSPQNP